MPSIISLNVKNPQICTEKFGKVFEEKVEKKTLSPFRINCAQYTKFQINNSECIKAKTKEQ